MNDLARNSYIHTVLDDGCWRIIKSKLNQECMANRVNNELFASNVMMMMVYCYCCCFLLFLLLFFLFFSSIRYTHLWPNRKHTEKKSSTKANEEQNEQANEKRIKCVDDKSSLSSRGGINRKKAILYSRKGNKWKYTNTPKKLTQIQAYQM